jgi:RND family efflux transporter MFP subunit
LLCACPKAPEVEPAAAHKRVTCAAVAHLAVHDLVELRGTVAPLPDRDALVAPQSSGRLLSVSVHEGDVVRDGQLLATVDDGPLVDAAHQTEAALARAKAEHDNARVTLERVKHVVERGIAARQELDDASTKVAAARAGEAEADAANRVAQRQLARASIRSPLSGVVIKLFRKPGELVDGTPATPVLEVADLSRLELLADVPARELVRLAVGQPASVRFSFAPAPLVGHVSRVSPSVDRATGIGTARVEFARPDAGSPPVGALGQARVETGVERDALLVPTVALRAGATEVVVCANGKASVVKVRAGTSHDDAGTEVEGELASDALVAVDPVVGLEDGDALEGPR